MKLEPCPLCRNQPQSRYYGEPESSEGYWGIDCCHIFVHEASEEDALAIWNALPRPASGGLEGAVRVVGIARDVELVLVRGHATDQGRANAKYAAEQIDKLLTVIRALPDSGEEIIPNDDGRRRLYSIDLQRIIEDLCRGGPIRVPETNARHHYDMAVNYLQALATTPEDKP